MTYVLVIDRKITDVKNKEILKVASTLTRDIIVQSEVNIFFTEAKDNQTAVWYVDYDDIFKGILLTPGKTANELMNETPIIPKVIDFIHYPDSNYMS